MKTEMNQTSRAIIANTPEEVYCYDDQTDMISLYNKNYKFDWDNKIYFLCMHMNINEYPDTNYKSGIYVIWFNSRISIEIELCDNKHEWIEKVELKLNEFLYPNQRKPSSHADP